MDSALLCPPVVWAALGTLRDRWGATAQGCTPGAPQSRDAQKGGGGNRSLAPALALARGWAGVEGSGVDLFLLLLRGLDHLLRDVGRHFLVAVELARVRGPALRERTQRRRVLVELGLRHERADPRLPAIRIHAQDLAAALVQVTDDVAHVLVGRDDLDLEDRLEQHGVGHGRDLLERHAARDLEGDVARVHGVVGAVEALGLEVDHRVAGEDALLRRLLDPLVHRRDELAGDHAADDRVRDHVAGPARQRLQADVAVAVLAVAARLLLVLALPLRLLADRLAVRDARRLGRDLDAVLVLQPLDLHVEVQLAEPADDRLPELRVVTAV